MSEFVSLAEIAREVGRHPGHAVRDIRRKFPELISRRRLNNQNKIVYVIPTSEKERVFLEMGYSPTGDSPVVESTRSRRDFERQCAKELEKQGFTTIVTKEKGTPDIVAFRKRTEGGFDLVFREAKGPTDSAHKEQIEFINKMKHLGVDADFQWFN